jgi:hypothetical protein
MIMSIINNKFLFSSVLILCSTITRIYARDVTYELEKYTIVNYFDYANERRRNFRKFLDSNCVVSEKNVYSRLKLVNKLTDSVVFDIGMIPADKIIVKGETIILVSKLHLQGLPNLVIVNFDGEILAIESLSTYISRCSMANYKDISSKYPCQIEYLQEQQAIRYKKKFVEIELGRVLNLGNCSFLKNFEKDINLVDSSFMEYNFSWTFTSAGKHLWYCEEDLDIRLYFKRQKLYYIKFNDRQGKSTKITIHPISCQWNCQTN